MQRIPQFSLQDRATILLACRRPALIRVLHLELTEESSGYIPKIQSFGTQGSWIPVISLRVRTTIFQKATRLGHLFPYTKKQGRSLSVSQHVLQYISKMIILFMCCIPLRIAHHWLNLRTEALIMLSLNISLLSDNHLHLRQLYSPH